MFNCNFIKVSSNVSSKFNQKFINLVSVLLDNSLVRQVLSIENLIATYFSFLSRDVSQQMPQHVSRTHDYTCHKAPLTLSLRGACESTACTPCSMLRGSTQSCRHSECMPWSGSLDSLSSSRQPDRGCATLSGTLTMLPA